MLEYDPLATRMLTGVTDAFIRQPYRDQLWYLLNAGCLASAASQRARGQWGAPLFQDDAVVEAKQPGRLASFLERVHLGALYERWHPPVPAVMSREEKADRVKNFRDSVLIATVEFLQGLEERHLAEWAGRPGERGVDAEVKMHSESVEHAAGLTDGPDVSSFSP